MIHDKTIALIAHDARKADMIEWVKYNVETLYINRLVCTGTTGSLIENTLIDYARYNKINEPYVLTKMKSGPMGGDAQIAAMVVEGKVDLCVFLIDDLSANPHEADIMMLLRQCRIHNIPVACNRHSADLMITSDLWFRDYKPSTPTYQKFDREEYLK
ncbi:MAG TPA: methylglyoxal synthase [Bacteroidales bacterium]|nr:methylglyoxal synthase [Bacteroidales bacterium]